MRIRKEGVPVVSPVLSKSVGTNHDGWWTIDCKLPHVPFTSYLHSDGEWRFGTLTKDENGMEKWSGYFRTRDAAREAYSKQVSEQEIILATLNDRTPYFYWGELKEKS
jgi:hypothetical protein